MTEDNVKAIADELARLRQELLRLQNLVAAGRQLERDVMAAVHTGGGVRQLADALTAYKKAVGG